IKRGPGPDRCADLAAVGNIADQREALRAVLLAAARHAAGLGFAFHERIARGVSHDWGAVLVVSAISTHNSTRHFHRISERDVIAGERDPADVLGDAHASGEL